MPVHPESQRVFQPVAAGVQVYLQSVKELRKHSFNFKVYNFPLRGTASFAVLLCMKLTLQSSRQGQARDATGFPQLPLQLASSPLSTADMVAQIINTDGFYHYFIQNTDFDGVLLTRGS